MPTVRRLERQVSLAPLPGVRRRFASTPEAEGAGIARAQGALAQAQAQEAIARAEGLARLGEGLARTGVTLFARIQEEEKRKADEAALLKASNRLSEWQHKRLYDPDAGAFTVKGERAMTLPEEIRAEFDQVADEIGRELGNDDQRAAWARLVARERDVIDLQVRRHVFREVEGIRAREFEAFVANKVDAAVRSALDPRLVALHLDDVTSAIQRTGPSLGLGPEQIAARVQAVQSRVHVGVISSLLSQGMDEAAGAYFEAARDEITGDKLDDIQRAIEEGKLRGRAQREADRIIAGGGTLAEQREQARQIEDPQLRDAVMQRIEHEHTIAERVRREQEEAAMREAYDILDRTADVTRIPPALWAGFSGSTRRAMREYARMLAAGTPVETDYPTYYRLLQQAGDDPQAFATANLLQFRHKLGETEFKQLANLQLSIKNGNRQAADKVLEGFRTRGQILEDTLRLYRIDPKADPDTDEGRAIALLRRLLDQRVDAMQAAGQKVTNTEIQRALDDLLSQEITIPGSWKALIRPFTYDLFDQRKRLVDLTIDDVPADWRRKIEERLRRNGVPITDATILEWYINARIAAPATR